MRVIGVTGFIGSGKTYLCKRFQEKYGIPVFYFDLQARIIMETDEFVMSELRRFYGEDIFSDSLEGGRLKLNTKKLANIIFTDEVERLRVELLIRGPLMSKFYHFAYLSANAGHLFILAESATLVKTKMYKLMDEIILVDADKEKSLEKLGTERNISRGEATRRMVLQHTTEDVASMLILEGICFNIFNNDYTNETVDDFLLNWYNAEQMICEMEQNTK